MRQPAAASEHPAMSMPGSAATLHRMTCREAEEKRGHRGAHVRMLSLTAPEAGQEGFRAPLGGFVQHLPRGARELPAPSSMLG